MNTLTNVKLDLPHKEVCHISLETGRQVKRRCKRPPYIEFMLNDDLFCLCLDSLNVFDENLQINEELTDQLSFYQEIKPKTTIFTFNDFELSLSKNRATGALI